MYVVGIQHCPVWEENKSHETEGYCLCQTSQLYCFTYRGEKCDSNTILFQRSWVVMELKSTEESLLIGMKGEGEKVQAVVATWGSQHWQQTFGRKWSTSKILEKKKEKRKKTSKQTKPNQTKPANKQTNQNQNKRKKIKQKRKNHQAKNLRTGTSELPTGQW